MDGMDDDDAYNGFVVNRNLELIGKEGPDIGLQKIAELSRPTSRNNSFSASPFFSPIYATSEDYDSYGPNSLAENSANTTHSVNCLNYLGLPRSSGSRLRYMPIISVNQRSALEIPYLPEITTENNDRPPDRSFSICSHTSASFSEAESAQTAPASLYSRGWSPDGMLWKRPQHDLLQRRPISRLQTIHSRNQDDSYPTRRRSSSMILEPNNEVSVHLQNLMTSNFTISPTNQEVRNLVFRGMLSFNNHDYVPLPTDAYTGSSSTHSGSNKLRRKRTYAAPKKIHTLRISRIGMTILKANDKSHELSTFDETRSI